MPIEIACGNCMKAFGVEAEWAGMAVECPFCQTAVQVPEEVRDLSLDESLEVESGHDSVEPVSPFNSIDIAPKQNEPDFGSIVFREQTQAVEFPGVLIRTDSSATSESTNVNSSDAESREKDQASLNPVESRRKKPVQPDVDVSSVPKSSEKLGASEKQAQVRRQRQTGRERELPPQDDRQSRWKLTEDGKVPATDLSVAAEPISPDSQATKTASVELPLLRTDEKQAVADQCPSEVQTEKPATAPVDPVAEVPAKMELEPKKVSAQKKPSAKRLPKEPVAAKSARPKEEGKEGGKSVEKATSAESGSADRITGIEEGRVRRPAKLPVMFRRSAADAPSISNANGPLGIVVRTGVTEIEYQGQKILLRDQPTLKKYYGLIAFIVSLLLLVLVLGWLSYRTG